MIGQLAPQNSVNAASRTNPSGGSAAWEAPEAGEAARRFGDSELGTPASRRERQAPAAALRSAIRASTARFSSALRIGHSRISSIER